MNGKIFKQLIKESLMNGFLEDIMTYLNKNYMKSSEVTQNEMGEYIKKPIIVKTINKETIHPSDLFYYLQEKYKNISSDKKKRDIFIKQCINDWYTNFYKKHGSLSKNIEL